MTNAQKRAHRPKTEGEQKLESAVAGTLAEDGPEGDKLTAADKAALGEGATEPDEQPEPSESAGEEEEDRGERMASQSFTTMEPDGETPEWAVIPEKLILPKGKLIYYMRIPADWTDRPSGGERHCIMWNLTVADEDMALKRSRGDDTRVNRELAMAMIRAVDGHPADWTLGRRGPGDVRKWFDAIGPRGRLLMQNIYLRTHTVDEEMRRRFFADCFAFTASP